MKFIFARHLIAIDIECGYAVAAGSGPTPSNAKGKKDNQTVVRINRFGFGILIAGSLCIYYLFLFINMRYHRTFADRR